MVDFAKVGAAAAAAGVDMTQAKAGGGGDYAPPAEGFVKLRFIGYIELGKHKSSYQGKEKIQDRVQLIFELSGPKHPVTVTEGGEKIPARITIEENLSLNEKANFFKLFQKMNYAGKAQHMAQLLGAAYLGTVFHDKWKDKSGKDRISAILRGPDGAYSIRPPRVDDPETGEPRAVAVDPAISPLRGWIWNHGDAEMWATLYIPGEYPERKDDKGVVTAPARSKNVLQEKIRKAINYEGSLAHQVSGGAAPLDLGDAELGRDALAEPTKPATAKPQVANATGSFDMDDDIPF